MQVLLGHGVRLGDNGDEIDSGSKSLHHLDIKGLDTVHQLPRSNDLDELN